MEQVDASIARYLAALDRADRQESDVTEAKTSRINDKIAGLRRQMAFLKEMEQQVQAAPDKQVSLTDPDARSMATSGRGTGMVGYNVQTAVDAEHHLIVAHEVTNLGHDRTLLEPMGLKALEATGCEEIMALADRAKAAEIARAVMSRYDAAEVDAVYLIYNEFKSILTPVQRVEKLLPLEVEAPSAAAGAANQVDFLYEQPAEQIFSLLVPRYVETQIYRMMAESSAAEHASRMTAMEAATSNASDVIDDLTLHMNKVRQAAITREIIEVVSGSSAAQ